MLIRHRLQKSLCLWHFALAERRRSSLIATASKVMYANWKHAATHHPGAPRSIVPFTHIANTQRTFHSSILAAHHLAFCTVGLSDMFACPPAGGTSTQSRLGVPRHGITLGWKQISRHISTNRIGSAKQAVKIQETPIALQIVLLLRIRSREERPRSSTQTY